MPRDKSEILADLALEAHETRVAREASHISPWLRAELGIALTSEQMERAAKPIGELSARQSELLTEMTPHLSLGE